MFIAGGKTRDLNVEEFELYALFFEWKISWIIQSFRKNFTFSHFLAYYKVLSFSIAFLQYFN